MQEHTLIPYCCHSEDELVELELFDSSFQNFLNSIIGFFVVEFPRKILRTRQY